MENYYRNFYPYRFYYPFNFRFFPYGKSNYRNSTCYKNEQNSKNASFDNLASENEGQIKQNSSETRKLDDKSNPIFEIFGIKLFFDDILLISLIFFLYTEGVKDQNLFIALILLLLS